MMKLFTLAALLSLTTTVAQESGNTLAEAVANATNTKPSGFINDPTDAATPPATNTEDVNGNTVDTTAAATPPAVTTTESATYHVVNNNNIHHAVKEWVMDKPSAKAKYGPIAHWDTSRVSS